MQRIAWRITGVLLMASTCLSPLLPSVKAFADSGSSIPLIPVTFTVKDNSTAYGQNVFLVGSIPQLGNWSPSQDVGPFNTNSSSYPEWTYTIDLPAGTVFQYKYLIENGADPTTASWATGNNQEYVVPLSGSGAVNNTFIAPSTLAFTSGTIAQAYANVPYAAQLEAQGGNPSYSYSVLPGSITSTISSTEPSVSGAVYGTGGTGSSSATVTGNVYTDLGDGLELTANGLISGTPLGAGTLAFTAKVTDQSGNTATQTESLLINSASVTVSPSSLQAGFATGTTLTVNGLGTSFASGHTTVSINSPTGNSGTTESGTGTTDLTADTTVNSPTQLTIAMPGGVSGIGAGNYTLTIDSAGNVESVPLTITPFTNASTIQWDGVYTSQNAPYLSNPDPAAGTQVTIGFRAYSGNLTGATLNYYDTVQNKGFSVAMTPGATFGPYQLWTATIPASAGGTEWYRFDLYDGQNTACLSGDGMHPADTNNNNFPVPTGGISFSSLHVNPGDTATINDPYGDFTGGSTTFSFINQSGQTAAQVAGQATSWTSATVQIPSTLVNGLYTVQADTVAKDADGAVNTELDRSSFLAVGPGHYWFDDLLHNSFSTFYRSPFGAVPQGTAITLRLRGPLGLTNPGLRLWNAAGNPNETDLPMQAVTLPASIIAAQTGDNPAQYSWWEVTIPASDVSSLGTMWYQFQGTYQGTTIYYGDNGQQLEGIGQPGTTPGGPSYQISVYQDNFQTPNWLRHAVIYQIFPDRFFNGNIANDENPAVNTAVGTLPNGQEGLVPVQFHKDWYSTPDNPAIIANPGDPNYASELALRGDGQWNMDFYGGDLQGINDKLDYLKSLGINTLYLTPIFQSDSVHKYDTGNFLNVDPGFGTMQDWLNLVKDAKARGLHILIDGAFEDTGSDSVYFNKFGNYQSVGAWQQYQNQSTTSPYYSWYDWTGNSAQPYSSWFGYDTLPLADTSNPSYQQFVYGGPKSVAEYWIENGASGWRLDSADNGNFSIPWWSAFRSAVKSVDPSAAIVGEVWGNATNDNGTDWLTGQTFDSVMNYQFRNAVIDFFRGTYNDGNEQHNAVDAGGFNAELMRLYSEYPLTSFYAMMNLVDSHDTMRILSVLSNSPDPSTLSAYQQSNYRPSASDLALGIARLKLVSDFQFGFPGDPTVFYGDEAGVLGYKDPLNRGPFPWGQENEDLVNHYRLLGAIRDANPVLQTGTFQPLLTQGSVYAFARTITGGKDVFGESATDGAAIVALNNQGSTSSLTLPVQGTVPDGTKMLDELTSTWYTVQNGAISLDLAPYQGVILIANPTNPVAYMQRSGAQSLIAWTPVADATRYQVLAQDALGHVRAIPVPPAAQSSLAVDVTALRGATPTQVTVEALPGPGAPGAPGGSSSLPVTLPAENLTMSAVQAVTTPHGVQLRWSAVAGASQYTVYALQTNGSYTEVVTLPVQVPGHVPGQAPGQVSLPLVGQPLGNSKGPWILYLDPNTADTTFRVAAANLDGQSVSSPTTATEATNAQPPATH